MKSKGCIGHKNIMEDAEKVEISREQLWQRIRNDALLEDGRRFSTEIFRTILNSEIEQARLENARRPDNSLDTAGIILDQLATDRQFPDFMTLLAYDRLE